ncbi:GPW/gp25 family protein [Micromonospora phytophila]|uniref:GPW/gp25 family protein n=1 Tax=Micromonospora phytophila TaxID=709888 RepID=UPI00203038AE|nr:GPW/gp25 family protein [Micromonospora phytophila]MCM0676058.1 GPW/gp25 family protein [Micromonospora phytophila]
MTAGRHVGHPLRVAGRGRTALVDDEEYLRGLVEAVLFTRPGERVNRPDFGSGVDRLVFAPAGDELAHATRALVHGALQRWLGDLLQVDTVTVEARDAQLRVTVSYLPLVGGAVVGERRSLTVQGGAP